MQYILIATAALLWGMSPHIGRLSGVSALPMAHLVAMGSVLATLPLLALKSTQTELFTKGGAIALSSGVLNGIGLVAFYFLVAGAAAGKWQMSTSLSMVYASVPVVVVIGSLILFQEGLNLNKIAGIALIAAAIYLLNKQ
jgi:drug/metabolite transporter (DMT)-like permease